MLNRKTALLITLFLALSLCLAPSGAVAKPSVKNAVTIVPADAADPMFTKPGKNKTCPAKATPVRLEGSTQCLWCPPGYHGHAMLKGAWMCYRCRTKKPAGMAALWAQGRLWCYKCRSGYVPKGGRCLKRCLPKCR